MDDAQRPETKEPGARLEWYRTLTIELGKQILRADRIPDYRRLLQFFQTLITLAERYGTRGFRTYSCLGKFAVPRR